VLVQPATVARWHREGLRQCWRRRAGRRPGRPRITAALRGLIQRMATKNRLWGAPRIHGELLKLGIVVSERTVSRYLPDRRALPSQTWRTFLANHLVLASHSTVTSANAPGDHEVVDAGDGLLRRAAPLPTEPCVINQWMSVDWSPPLQRTSTGSRVTKDLLHGGRCAQSGRDPPEGGRADAQRLRAEVPSSATSTGFTGEWTVSSHQIS